jgi:hypothetical protein
MVNMSSEDRRRHRHTAEKGRVLDFVVQYETRYSERWLPVVRYDTAHGYPHKHLFHADGSQDRSRMKIVDNNEALNIAEDDIQSNWIGYKARFLKEAKHDT